VQEKQTTNDIGVADVSAIPECGRLIALDPGTKRIGVAVCDELRVTTRPLNVITRTSWKKLLSRIHEIISEFDAKALIIGLPLESDGSESEMSLEARRMARNFSLSLSIPVFLEDERVTSYEAKSRLWAKGKTVVESRILVDSVAAAIILEDFLARVGSTR